MLNPLLGFASSVVVVVPSLLDTVVPVVGQHHATLFPDGAE
jgi:hypothetical protein